MNEYIDDFFKDWEVIAWQWVIKKREDGEDFISKIRVPKITKRHLFSIYNNIRREYDCNREDMLQLCKASKLIQTVVDGGLQIRLEVKR